MIRWLCTLSVLFVSAAAKAQVAVGQPARPLSVDELLQAPPNAAATLEALQGKVVVIEFWATWCAPCITAIPHLNELAAEFEDEPVVFISITEEPRAKVEPFLERRPISGWVGLDLDGSMREHYRHRGIPHTYLIGRDGTMLGHDHPQGLTSDHIRAAIDGQRVDFGQVEERPATDTVPATPRADALLPVTRFAPGQLPEDHAHDFSSEPALHVLLRPTRYKDAAGMNSGSNRLTLIGVGPPALLNTLFDGEIDIQAELPDQRFDLVINVPEAHAAAARELARHALEQALGVRARSETREIEVAVMRVAEGGHKLQPTVSTGGSGTQSAREGDHLSLQCVNASPSVLVSPMRAQLRMPVIDETGIAPFDGQAPKYDFEITLSDDREQIRQALAELGLTLVIERRPIEHTVVEPRR